MTSGSRDDIVSAYIEVIKQDSAEAATVIEEIRSVCGVRAALRAMLVLTLVKTEFHESPSIPSISTYSALIREFPDARLLLEGAVSCCLLAWSTARDERLLAFGLSHGLEWIQPG